MAREDWMGGRREALPRPDPREREDFGQADYSTNYGYDPRTRTGYRQFGPSERGRDGYDYISRSYDPNFRRSRAVDDRRPDARRGPSDRVLWAVIVERLEDERRLDLRDVEVSVHNGEVFLTGSVRHKADKRRIEDVADIEGVRNVQNNLRVRERGGWGFF